MVKQVWLLLLGIASFSSATLVAGGKNSYNPAADAKAEVKAAAKRAELAKKHVLLIVGGNWCSWCKKLDKLLTSDDSLSKILANNYELVHVNYSDKNKNLALLSELNYPQRFGFPVLLVLDAKGRRLHTQSSGYLEEGKGHSAAKVAAFLKNWTSAAHLGKSKKGT